MFIDGQNQIEVKSKSKQIKRPRETLNETGREEEGHIKREREREREREILFEHVFTFRVKNNISPK